MYLISAYFDSKTANILQGYINTVAEVTDNQFMVEHEVPPHLTLVALEARSDKILYPAFETIKEVLVSGDITIASPGMLLPYVLYVTPVLNDYLQQIQKQVYDAFSQVPEVRMNKYYTPMQWLPHITIGKQLSNKQMKLGVEVMIDRFTPLVASITEIGLARVNPHRNLVQLSLHGTGSRI